MEKSWEKTTVKFFSKKLQVDFSLTFPEQKWTPPWTFSWEGSEDKNNFFYLVSKFAKITFHIYVALKRTVFCLQLCYFSSANGNFKVQKKRGMFPLLFTVWAFPYSSYFFVAKDEHRNIFTSLVVPFSGNWTKRHEKSFVFLWIIFEEWHPAFAI